MEYCVISWDVKIAAVRLYECELLGLENILDCFSCCTWFRVLRIWCETGDVIMEKSSLWGCLCNIDQDNLCYLLMVIRNNPDYFLDELLHCLETNHFISVHYATIFNELVCLKKNSFRTSGLTLLDGWPSMIWKSLASLMKCQRMSALLEGIVADLRRIAMWKRSKFLFMAKEHLLKHYFKLILMGLLRER